MMRLGTDIVKIARIQNILKKHSKFVDRILTPAELKVYDSFTHSTRQLAFLAGRFASKEAYSKALGIGINHPLKFTDIEILPDSSGNPRIVQGPVLHPDAIVSISHEEEYAMATVIINLSEEHVQELTDQRVNKGV